MHAELFLDPSDRDTIAAAIWQFVRNQEEAQAANSWLRIRPRQKQVPDPRGHVMIAVRDPDLLSGYLPA